MTDTDAQMIEGLISRLDTEFASEDSDDLRAAAVRLSATDQGLSLLAFACADLAELIDRRDRGRGLPPEPDNDLEIGRVTVTRHLTDDGDDDIRITTEPDQMSCIDIAGMLTTALACALADMGRPESEEDA